MPLFTETSDGATCAVRVTPRAGRTAVAGIRDATLLVKLAAAPVDGAANDALVALLADFLVVPKRDIAIASGSRSRQKRVRVRGVAAATLDARVSRLLGEVA